MNYASLQHFIDGQWENEIIPKLCEYIRIPNKSPAFDSEWEANGHMERAVNLVADWCKQQPVKNLTLEVMRLPGRTPVIFIEIAGNINETILLYGHLDKQPEMTGWEEGLSAWQPVLRDDKLYGRGGADDGYAAFASLTAIAALQQQNLPHARCVILIEACEESGSYDLPFYLAALEQRIGTPNFVICLDSASATYDRLWSTTSLRGLIGGTLRIDVSQYGVHSGGYSGAIPSSFRILRTLLDRLEDNQTGEMVADFHTTIPPQRITQTRTTAEILGPAYVQDSIPLLPGVSPVTHDIPELLLNRTWRPTLCITGVAGIPPLENAGNVLRPFTAVHISIRVPPNADAEKVSAQLKTILEKDPPYNAKVTFTPEQSGAGWNAPLLAPWLEAANEAASLQCFGQTAAYMGEGGSIPFMGMLGQRFPAAQFLITGVLGPKSNAHGPNEFLHIPYAKRITHCIAMVINAHYKQFS